MTITVGIIEPTKERRQHYVADVPLICDPVPGPSGIITIRRALSAVEVDRLRAVMAASNGGIRSIFVGSEATFARAGGARTQWPDAEFCAA